MITNTLLAPVSSTHLLISKDGYSFDRNSNKWALNKDVAISFQSEVLALDAVTLEGFRLTLARYAEELSAHHTRNMYFQFQRLIRDTSCVSLDVNVLINWKAILHKDHEWYLGALKGFLIAWYDYGHHGVTADMVELLESFTLAGNIKGVAVANRCPYSGSFTENEVLAINGELIELWRNEEISFPCYAYLNLLQATARRPTQLRQLKACDLLKKSDQGVSQYFLNIPRSKQRGIGFREAFNKLQITEELYLILLNLVLFQTKKIESIFQAELDEKHKQLIPMFADVDLCEKFSLQSIAIDNAILKSDVLHLRNLNYTIYAFAKKQRAISERTGDIIHITARRFRHTRGTNLGRKGIGVRIIAEALDHSDSQNVKVYAENTADTVQFIDKAVGKQLAPFANAFLGRIILELKDGERGEDPTAHIPNDKNEAIGACGTNDFCVNGYESCYVCRKFRPLLDGPHELVLNELYKEKEEKLKNTGSIQYASVKDRLILAVEQVVMKCREIKGTRKQIND